VRISVLKRTGKKIKDFEYNEWKSYNIEHYGGNGEWKSGKGSIIIREKDKIIGLLKFKHDAGVFYVGNIIVIREMQKKGIGRKLMEKMEETARKSGCHKIYLYTGKGWGVENFYEKLGYKKTSDLPKHFMRKDFVEFVKFIE